MQISDRIERLTVRINSRIVSNPKQVIILFLLLTGVFAAGMTLVTTETEADDAFTEGLEVQEAQDAIDEEFEDAFEANAESTTLIHQSSNVLSQKELLASLTVLERIDDRDRLRMDSANGPAPAVATALDPDAETPAEQRRAVERASETEIRQAVRQLGDNPGFLSDDYNRNAASASVSITAVSHDVPPGFDDSDDLTEIQTAIQDIANSESGDIRAFGSGIVNDEFGQIIGDSLAIVMPVVVVLLLIFLVVAYRDPIDLSLGLLALVMTIIWTFGFVGYSGIPFDQNMISVPVLLLAVGVDFGIHIINRYREETVQGFAPTEAMMTANNQLMVAFVIVTVTAAFGFGANIISDLSPIRNLGIVSAVGIVFTFVIFGIFLPAMKLWVDNIRERYNVPEFNSTPIASEESALGRVLAAPAVVTQKAPAVFVVLILLSGVGMGVYGAGVDTTFDTDDFLPPEEQPAYVEYIPEPFAPGEYTVTENINLLEDRFDADQDATVTVYIEGPFEQDHALEALDAPNDDPPDSLAVGPGGSAVPTSILTVIQTQAERNPEFGALVARNDRTGDGIPDRNLDRIYDELASIDGANVDDYLADDRRSAQVQYQIDAEATQPEAADDTREFATEFRYAATATGGIIVFDAVGDLIFETAIQGMILALILTGVFLMGAYAALERQPALGLVNVFPILIAVTFLLGTMRLLGIPLNALTATILSISIGIGIAYSVHITHRFLDEFKKDPDTFDALMTTLIGTGGALTGSMLTTSLGTGALALAITPVLGDFGLLMAISVLYSFITAIVALPPAIFLYAKVADAEYSWRVQRLVRRVLGV